MCHKRRLGIGFTLIFHPPDNTYAPAVTKLCCLCVNELDVAVSPTDSAPDLRRPKLVAVEPFGVFCYYVVKSYQAAWAHELRVVLKISLNPQSRMVPVNQ